jgi:tetratricopeptide (TPR) repeat protein
MNRKSVWTIITFVVCGVAFAATSAEIATGDTAPILEATLGEAIDGYAMALDTVDRDLRLEAFRRAERLFGSVLDAGNESPDLYANLGNAALQAEHLGAAVLAYRRALVLDPDQSRASQNLEHVRGLAPEWVPRPESSTFLDSFFSWHQTISDGERAMAAGLAFAIASLLFALGIGVRSVAARNAAILPGLIWGVLIASMLVNPASVAKYDAVVVAREVVARSADSIHSPARFARPLPTGTEVRILESRDTWLRIALANGREAWVRSSSVERVLH